MIPDSWLYHLDGPGPGIVLAVDYETGQEVPTIGALAGLLDVGLAVVQPEVIALTGSAAGPDPGDRLLTAWLDDLRGTPVAGIIGNCAGAALACGVAARIGTGPDGPPPVVLLDPEPVTGSMMWYQFSLAVGQFEEFVGTGLIADLLERGKQVCRSTQLPEAVGALCRMYQQVCDEAAVELELDEEIVAELTGKFDRYLDYLLAAWDTGFPSSPSQTTVLLSTGYRCPDGLAGQVVNVPFEHARLTAVPEVAELVTKALRDSANPA